MFGAVYKFVTFFSIPLDMCDSKLLLLYLCHMLESLQNHLSPLKENRIVFSLHSFRKIHTRAKDYAKHTNKPLNNFPIICITTVNSMVAKER